MSIDDCVQRALDIARQYGGSDGADHKMWVIDQMVRALTGCPMVEQWGIGDAGRLYTYAAQGESSAYLAWVTAAKEGEDGPETYSWDTGIAP